MIAVLVAAICFLAALAMLGFVLDRFQGFGAAAPNERSNHKRPTPQIGGIAIVPIWLGAMVALSLSGITVPVFGEPTFLIAVALLFALGVTDDRNPLGPLPKLAAQAIACALAAHGLADVLAGFPGPPWLSLAVCALLLLTIVNLTNFVDGLDLMAVATVGVPSAGFALFAAAGVIGYAYLPVGLATCAVFLAFAVYNWHPARTFLGDGGSLPFGLVLGAMTVVTAAEAGVSIAALLPAYILFDGCVTLVRRALRGERLMQAHSNHLYQRAFRSGRAVLSVSLAAALFGTVATVLALLAVQTGSLIWQIGALSASGALWVALERRLPIRS